MSSLVRKARILLTPAGIKSKLIKFCRRLVPSSSLYECSLCIEHKTARHFLRRRQLPVHCILHVHLEDEKRVCRECLSEWLKTQLGTVHVSMLGCPQCREPWASAEVLRLLSSDQRRLYKMKLRRAKIATSYQPPDQQTLLLMVRQDCRLCTHCGEPFEIISRGCGYMTCAGCRHSFYFSDAPTVREAHQAHEVATTR